MFKIIITSSRTLIVGSANESVKEEFSKAHCVYIMTVLTTASCDYIKWPIALTHRGTMLIIKTMCIDVHTFIINSEAGLSKLHFGYC